jgi:hypothetical protein
MESTTGFDCSLSKKPQKPLSLHFELSHTHTNHESIPSTAHCMARASHGLFLRGFVVTVLLCLLSSTFSPVAMADVGWEEDGWLRTALAQERLDNGDEFGCYGMPHLSWQADPGAVALECQKYITGRVDASHWGANPVSTFTPPGLTMSQHTTIAGQGFPVQGDMNGLTSTAWHTSEDSPVDDWDWFNLGRRGGSLEQIIGSKEQVQSAVEEGGLVNLYWVGRVNDATIRHDKDIEEYLDFEAQAWMTTWGEAWSYWNVHDCYEIAHSSSVVANQTIIEFESLLTEQCTAVAPLAWNVPMTWILDVGSESVVDVRDANGTLQPLEGVKKTSEGYTHTESEYLHLSVLRGHNVSIVVNGTDDYDVVGRSQFWNNYSSAVTIAAHDTTDLFKWSKRFTDESNLVFTWLVQPRDGLGEAPWLPFLAVIITVSTITGMMYILKREGLGPFGNKNSDTGKHYGSRQSMFEAE